MGKVAARLVGTVKNSSDRGSCGSCKHELVHGETNVLRCAALRCSRAQRAELAPANWSAAAKKDVRVSHLLASLKDFRGKKNRFAKRGLSKYRRLLLDCIECK